jgi:hypothetical protein
MREASFPCACMRAALSSPKLAYCAMCVCIRMTSTRSWAARLPIPHLRTSPPFPPPPPCMRRRIRAGVVSALHVALTRSLAG